jgi:hypothetical protein
MIPITGILAGVAIVLGLPLVRAYTRRLELQAQQPRVDPEVAARLERMEQAIDAIAVEVERIAEGQRFTTRLLSERASAGQPIGQPIGQLAGLDLGDVATPLTVADGGRYAR